MLEKFKTDDAFILLESILSLSIVSFTLIVILPFSVQLLQSRQNRQMAIEGYRVLYDYSYSWQGEPGETAVTRSGHAFMIGQTSNQLEVTMPNGEIIKVEVVR